MPKFLAALFAAAALAPSAVAATPRILYASDWTGPTQIFAADPAGRAPAAQLTFDRIHGGCHGFPGVCGFVDALPSPDGRRIAYWSAGFVDGGAVRTLWLAAADGRSPRRLGSSTDAAWSPNGRSLAYGTTAGLHVVDVRGADRLLDRAGVAAVAWSPDGETLAAIGDRGLLLVRAGRVRVRARVPAVAALAWSPDGHWLSYLRSPTSGPWTVEAITAAGPLKVRNFGVGREPAWSADGRFLAWTVPEGIAAWDVAANRVRRAARFRTPIPPYGLPLERTGLASAPSGHAFAYSRDGLHVVDAATRRDRVIAREGGALLAWARDGRSVTFVAGTLRYDNVATGDLRVASLGGRVRTVVPSGSRGGGQIVSLAWTTPPAATRYRGVEPVDGVFGAGPVTALAADDARVAWLACSGVRVWSLETAAVSRADARGERGCPAPSTRDQVYAVALAGDRIAWAEKTGGLGFGWTLYARALGAATFTVAAGTGTLGGPLTVGTGTPVGSGSLLVVSSWRAEHTAEGPKVREQTLRRVEAGGCSGPCPAIGSSPGPYVPLDVEGGRVVVAGDNEVHVLDGSGSLLRAFPIRVRAAQLSGSLLVVATRGRIVAYDLGSGAVRSSWPLADVETGHACNEYADPTCARPPAQLVLEDVARGLAAYLVDGRVHVLRLADGVDADVAWASAARFAGAGLVYADGARVRLRGWDALPAPSA